MVSFSELLLRNLVPLSKIHSIVHPRQRRLMLTCQQEFEKIAAKSALLRKERRILLCPCHPSRRFFHRYSTQAKRFLQGYSTSLRFISLQSRLQFIISFMAICTINRALDILSLSLFQGPLQPPEEVIILIDTRRGSDLIFGLVCSGISLARTAVPNFVSFGTWQRACADLAAGTAIFGSGDRTRKSRCGKRRISSEGDGLKRGCLPYFAMELLWDGRHRTLVERNKPQRSVRLGG